MGREMSAISARSFLVASVLSLTAAGASTVLAAEKKHPGPILFGTRIAV
jgi:hypothetical protein